MKKIRKYKLLKASSQLPAAKKNTNKRHAGSIFFPYNHHGDINFLCHGKPSR
jgi:hypothetical protein